MRRCLQKSVADGLKRGFGTAAAIQSVARRRAVACARIKVRNPCGTGRIRLKAAWSEKVKMEISA